MLDRDLTGAISRTAIPISLVVAGLGWLLYSYAAPRAERHRNRSVLARRASELLGLQPPRRAARRRVIPLEPMAGYGG